MSGSMGEEISPIPGVRIQGRSLLEKYGLRATRQRLGLAKLLFSKGHRHLTAEALALEAHAVRIPASLATIYNVLNLFAQVGLVRSLAIEGTKTIFDTNTSDHCHFFFEDTGEVCDIAKQGMTFACDVEPPEGYEIVAVDVVVRLRPKTNSSVRMEAGRCGFPAA